MHIENDDFNKIYKALVKNVINNGQDVTVRNKKTKELTNCIISLTNIDNDKICFDKTKSYNRQEKYEEYRKNEIRWYESGCLVAEHAPSSSWMKIADKNGKIQSNYGYMMFHDKKPYADENDVTSYENVLDILIKEKSSRQAILHYNLPEHYGNNGLDIPCTICTQVLVRNDKLFFMVFQRSSDLYLGLPYDLPWHCYLMKKIIVDLNLKYKNITCGALKMLLGSVHIYENNMNFFENFLKPRRKKNAKK